MRYTVTYRDGPTSAATIEAPSPKDAATIFFFQNPTSDERTIIVTNQSGQAENFKTSELLPAPSANESSDIQQPLRRRYTDAYRIARAITAVGETVKVIAFVIGGGIALFGLVAGSKSEHYEAAVGGIILGAIVAIPIWVLGILVAALGQILKATLDTAVNTSPLLTKDEMRQIMSLN